MSYVINREHPLIKKSLQADSIDASTLNRLLRLAEEYIPIQQIWVDAAEGDEMQAQPFESAATMELVEMIQLLYRAYRISGLSHSDSLGRLGSTEAFGDHHELIEPAVDDIQHEVL